MSGSTHVFPLGGDRCSLPRCGKTRTEIRAEDEIASAAERRKPTRRQAELIEFMRRYTAEHGMPPTLREIGDEMDIASTNGVTDHLRALLAKGLVRNAPGRSRGWRLA